MPLQKSIVPVVLQKSPEQKIDAKVPLPGRISALDNCEYTKSGLVSKREGFRTLNSSVTNNLNANVNYQQLYSANNILLAGNTDFNIYTYNANVDGFYNNDLIYNVPLDVEITRLYQTASVSAANNVEALSQPTVVGSATGIKCVVGVDIMQNGIVQVYGDNNNLVFESIVAANVLQIKATYVNNTFIIWYIRNNGDVCRRSISSVVPAVLSAQAVLMSDAHTTSPSLTVKIIQDNYYIAYKVATTALLKVLRLSYQFTILSNVTYSGLTVDTAGNKDVPVTFVGAQGYIFIATYNSATLTGIRLNYDLTIITAAYSIGVHSANIVTVTSAVSNIDSIAIIIEDVNRGIHYMDTNTLTGVTSASIKILQNIEITSEMFVYANGINGGLTPRSRIFFLGAIETNFQSKTCLFDLFGSPHLTIGTDVTTTSLNSGIIPNYFKAISSIYNKTTDEHAAVIKSNNFDAFSLVDIEFNVDIVSSESGITSGGFVQNISPASCYENNFLLQPELTANSQATVAGGVLPLLGSYAVCVVYEYLDDQNKLHRSAPSNAIIQALTGGNNTINITFTPNYITKRNSTTAVIYRSVNLGATFYRTAYTYEIDPLDSSISVNVGGPGDFNDVQLISQEFLYTTGDVLPNTNIGAVKGSIAEFDNRVFCISAEYKNRVYYTKNIIDGLTPSFNEGQFIELPPSERITALQTFKSSLIIFTNQDIYVLQGTGPTDLGSNSNYRGPDLLHSDIGCVGVNQSCRYRDQVIFFSGKYIYSMTAGAAPVAIGANIEDYLEGLTIQNMHVSAIEEKLYVSVDANFTLVYDFFFSSWSRYMFKSDQFSKIDSTAYLNRSDNKIRSKAANTYTDNSQPYRMTIELNWMSFVNIQQLQRIYRFIFIGEFKSPHRLKIEFAYDFIDSFVDVLWADYTELPPVYGDGIYGLESPYGGQLTAYQSRVRLPRQKLQSLKIRLSDTDIVGESFSLTGLSFEVGAKNRLGQTRASRTL